MCVFIHVCVRIHAQPEASFGVGWLEVFHAGEWGTVCSQQFGVEEVNVTCRQLGWRTGALLSSGQPSPAPVNETLWLSGVSCNGNGKCARVFAASLSFDVSWFAFVDACVLLVSQKLLCWGVCGTRGATQAVVTLWVS